MPRNVGTFGLLMLDSTSNMKTVVMKNILAMAIAAATAEGAAVVDVGDRYAPGRTACNC